MPARNLAADGIHDRGTAAVETGRGGLLLALGGIFGALAASSCCIVPLVLFGLGVSGAWIANLTALGV